MTPFQLTNKQADRVCELMNVMYHHHDNDRKYTEDKNTCVYFYQSQMSHYTFKLDTLTGECAKDEFLGSDLSNKMEDFLIEHDETYTPNPKRAEWKERNKKVIEYLKDENLT